MDIAEVIPRQLAPSVGSEEARTMNSTASSSSTSSSAGGGDQIRFGTVNFLPHPPALLPAFVDFGQEMDLTIGSFNFLVGTQGSFRLSDPIFSDLSAGNPGSPGSSTPFVDPSNEANSSPSYIDSAESGENLANTFGTICFGSTNTSKTDLLQGDGSASFSDRDFIDTNCTGSKEVLAD